MADSDQSKAIDTESAPLLVKTQVPIQYLQLFFICVWRASQPIQYSGIFPYICFFIEELGIARGAEVGPIASYVETAASVGCYVGMPFWTIASDRFGRKPTILCAIFAAAIATSLFGFSTQLWHMIAFRFLLGMSNGQMVISRVLLFESTHPSNLASCVPFFSLGWQIGGTIGPAIGGYLSRPADHLALARSIPWLVRFPYALPGIVAGSIPASFLPWAMWKLQETHPKFRQTASSRPTSDQDSPLSPSRADMKETQLVEHTGAFNFLTRHILFYLLVCVLMHVINGFLMNTFVLVAYADDSIGGLGLQTQQIASILMARTIMIPLIELPLFAKIHRRFGSDRMLRFFICLPLVLPLLLPLLVHIKAISGSSPTYYAVLAVFLVIWVVWNLAGVTMGMLMADLPRRPEDLGKVAAVCEVTANVGYPVGLLVAGNAFAWSKQHPEILAGNAVWVLAISLFAAIALFTQRWQSERRIEA